MTRAEAKKRIEQLAAEIHEHDHRYYVLDKPTISDAHYDQLFRELGPGRNDVAASDGRAHRSTC